MFFLDEIQNVDNFEVIVNSLRASVKNISIFITGSNSKMLSDELSTVLSGRYVLFNISPLTYKEYIELTWKEAYDMNNFWDYAKCVGFPIDVILKEKKISKIIYMAYLIR